MSTKYLQNTKHSRLFTISLLLPGGVTTFSFTTKECILSKLALNKVSYRSICSLSYFDNVY